MLHFHSENELKSTNLLVNVVSLDCSITGVSVLSENGKVLYHFVDSGKQPADDHDGTEVKKVLLHQRRLFGDIIVNSEATFVHCIGVGPFHNITIQESVYLVASSHHHTLFCTSTRVLSWGIGNHGELGLGRDRLRADEPSVISTLAAKSVAVGEYHSCYALQDGSFYTFGCGAFHRLGLGDDESRYTPTLVEDLLTVGDLRADGTMSGVESVSCGFWHTFVVSSGVRDVYSWGWNKFGQVSDSASELGKVIPTPQRISGLDSLLSDEDDVVQAACGHRFTLLRTVSGNLLILGELGVTQIDDIDQGLDWWLSTVSGTTNSEIAGPDRGLRFLHRRSTNPFSAGTKRKLNGKNNVVQEQGSVVTHIAAYQWNAAWIIDDNK